MTNEEAIKDWAERCRDEMTFAYGDKAEDMESYKAFTGVIELFEKQIPKKPVFKDDYEVYCPFCGNEFYFQPKFCDDCGQAILSHDVEEEWQEEEE